MTANIKRNFNSNDFLTTGQGMNSIGEPGVTDNMIGRYSVIQSDGNIFCGVVVLDSFNMENSDEDSILDKKYQKQIFW